MILKNQLFIYKEALCHLKLIFLNFICLLFRLNFNRKKDEVGVEVAVVGTETGTEKTIQLHPDLVIPSGFSNFSNLR